MILEFPSRSIGTLHLTKYGDEQSVTIEAKGRIDLPADVDSYLELNAGWAPSALESISCHEIRGLLIRSQPLTRLHFAVIIKSGVSRITLQDCAFVESNTLALELPATHVIELAILSSQLQNQASPWLSSFPELETLNLTLSAINEEMLPLVPNQQKLKSLSLAKTGVSRPDVLWRASTLQHCDLWGCPLTDGNFQYPSLSICSLVVRETPVNDTDLEHLSKWPKIRDVSLRSTNISDVGVKHLANIGRTLRRVDISQCQITDSSLPELIKLGPKFLFIKNTLMSQDGMDFLQRALPKTRIVK